ncbi:hypothetical protein [Haloarcula argentinensis]|uniref:hypothetical protein n=1 Tax=Haloarcula argentinensis TaxID=43776 RepID=UPI0002B0EFF0|nr:hypothetical protein [Haloarcula argentinensis]EMA19005.1 hypothetical protein C443_17883 [Haloarcula argentinensis DSM 12282]
MTAQSYPIIEITGYVDGTYRTGKFHLPKSTVEEIIRTGQLVSNGFSQALSAISRVVDDVQLDGISIDNGAGQRVWQIDAELNCVEDGQWGYSDDASVLDPGSATGGDRIQKAEVLLNYLETGTDSLTPAKLIYGGYSPGGFMPQDGVDVYIEDPSVDIRQSDSSTAPLSLTCVRTQDLSQPMSGTEQNG